MMPTEQSKSHAAVCSTPLVDGCGRRIDHLRLSITGRCNLGCQYCSPRRDSDARHMDAAFAVALVRWLSGRHDVRHVRLTGGEPLVHPRVVDIVAAVSELRSLDEVTLTTNGQMLDRWARPLRESGLTRINVSLDTLRAERFDRLTSGGDLSRTLQGIEAAVSAGLTPVRLNVVVQRGINDDELCDLAEWGFQRGCTVRFLELMRVGPRAGATDGRLVPAVEILRHLSRRFALRPIAAPVGQPATDFVATCLERGLVGRLGLIASTTRPFCARCRRLRITAQGEILSCLFAPGGPSLAEAWNGGALDEERADRMLQAAVMAKPRMGRREQRRWMVSIGG